MALGLFIINNWAYLLLAIYFAIAVYNCVLIVLNKLDPVKTMSWVIVMLLLPYVGVFLYYFFGQNFRKNKIFSRKGLRDVKFIDLLSRQQILQIKSGNWGDLPYEEKYKNLITLLIKNSKAILTSSNEVTLFFNGVSTFEAMKKAISEAKNSIHLESYIIENDKIGNEFKDLLLQKAAEGVEVRVIYDDVGSWSLSHSYIQSLKKGGAEIYPFSKVTFPWLTSRVNYRNHRKILVVDGKIGFTGGINIADRYANGGYFGNWRDTHMCITGEAVHSLQAIFLLDWFFVSKKQLGQRSRYYPKNEVSNTCFVQIAACGPDSDWASIMQTYFAAIAGAKRRIYITTPYFTPNESILSAIKVASLSGVDVRLIIPAKSDTKITYWGTLSYMSELLDAGVKVYLFSKGFNHSKVMVVDGEFAAVGSANMDNRSFEHNFEISALIYDPKIAKELENQFMSDIKNSRLVRARWWNKRSNAEKVRESFARLMSPLL